MLAPKRVKHRKQHRGNMRGKAKGHTEIQYGDYAIVALEPGWITNRQIEASRVAMTRHIKRGGKVWITIFPDKPVTKKPAETRMGSGKGNPEGWVAVVRPGRVMFELAGVSEPLAREAMLRAQHKLPIKTKFITRVGEYDAEQGRRAARAPGRGALRAHGQREGGAVQPAVPAGHRPARQHRAAEGAAPRRGA